MPQKTTYDEFVQRIRKLEPSADDLKNPTIIPREIAQIFKHCFENANVGVCLVEPDGDFIKVNNRMSEIFGYSIQEFEGMNVNDVSHPEDIAISLEVQRRVKVGEIESTLFQKRYIHKKGHTFWGQVSNSIVKDHKGKPLYFVTHFMDITESKKNVEALQNAQNDLKSRIKERTAELSETNDALREREEKYRLLFNSCNDSIFVHQPKVEEKKRTFIEVNDMACKMYGYSKEELLALSPDDLMIPDRKEKSEIFIRDTLSEGRNVFEVIHKTKDGRKFPVEISSYLFDYQEQPTILSIVRDISERKRTDRLLRESEEQFRHFFEHLTIGIAVYEAVEDGNDFIFVDMNPAGQELSKISIDEIRGERLTQIFPTVRDLGLLKALQNTWRTGQPSHIPFSEYKDGRITQWVENRTFRLPSGKVAAIYDDRTDLISLEKQLQHAQKMESIGNLAGGIAHDFNNILSSIIGFTELALEAAPKGSSQRSDLEEVYIAGNRAKELVQQILAFARQSEKETTPIRLSDIVTEALKLLRPSTPTTIDIIPTINSEAKVMGNSSQMHQIIMNLCTNAVHSLQKSGGILRIDLRDICVENDFKFKASGILAGEYVELSITDNGPGIDREIIMNIFEPYFTTKEVGEGTGMGLAMVKGIVESYSGDIHVESEPWKKTSFVIRLPVTTDKSSRVVNQADSVDSGTERILFVDDEPPIARMGSRMLESLGYRVTTRTSSFEALELFKKKADDFDLVITDMTMPSMTGDVLSLELRRIRQDIPIILCTGYSIKINDEGAKQIGIDAFVYKPFTKPDLAGTIREVLGTKRLSSV